MKITKFCPSNILDYMYACELSKGKVVEGEGIDKEFMKENVLLRKVKG